MRTLIWFAYFWLYLLLLIPKMRRAERAEREGDTELRDEIVELEVSRWAGRLLKLAGVRVTVSGLENIPVDRPVVFVANHQGYFDIPVLLTFLDKPHGLVAKDATEKIPLVRGWMRLLGCVFIDRSNARQSVGALGVAARRLHEENRSFIIFPEGTRGRGGSMREFKNGGFKIAFKAGAPIVPICIDGTYKAMEARHNFIGPADVRLTVLPLIETEGMTREDSKAIGERVREMVAKELENHRND